MTISSSVRIGADTIDITRPCDVVGALKKMQLKLATGGLRQTVRIDGEEVTFQSPNDRRLASLIDQYQAECDRQSGSGRRVRYAKRFRFG
ncbi:hypothetical protein [Pseudooceanicola sp. HF7]|uniref:hypothetical protein n=1 Tax=Pseudooceanicola sp. HF7 TaxID=2721560 RepID=UPI00142FE51F|nr:hypothetical protein [Pseudooceanicola sp. HF7]NIZ11078.1 hypothetical protein [Pseudooceanicola sp. HF7]